MMTTAPASFAVANSPSGERVKVAGRSVHHQSWGSVKPGHPTLWLENGWFGQLLGWGALPELLCQDGWCVRAYDRGNYGWSQGAAEDRIADRAEAGQLREADIGDYIEPDTQACFRERYLRLLLESAAHWRTYAAEMVALKLSSEQARVRPMPASLPLIALIADRPPLASISDPYQRALAAGWRVSQEAAASGNYRYVSAGHVIHRDAPEAILAAVREMREAIAV